MNRPAARPGGDGLFFEDFAAGQDLPEASLVVDGEDAADFAARYGPGAPDPDGSAEATSPLSGIHVASLGMRLLFDAFLGRTAGLGAPGIDEVTWPNPVRPGDVLRFTARVEAVRPSASRPEMGLVTVAIAVLDQRGALVMTQRNAIMVRRRDIPEAGT